MKFKKFFYKKVNSTNDLAIRKIKKGFNKGIIICEFQKKGRGQLGKKWKSFKGNLLISIFFEIKKNLSVKKMTSINCKIIKKSLSNYIVKKINIKNPNDLQINNKKFCGILQEIIFRKNDKFIIVGIGINLLKHPFIQTYPTTNIFKETGIKLEKTKLIKSIEANYINKLKLFA